MKLIVGRLIFRCLKLWLITLNGKINLNFKNSEIWKNIFIFPYFQNCYFNQQKTYLNDFLSSLTSACGLIFSYKILYKAVVIGMVALYFKLIS